MNKTLPLALGALIVAAIAYLILFQPSEQAPPAVDPQLGRACFEQHRADLPPGSQYEGIAGAEANVLTIKVMDGVGVVARTCELTPDGRLAGTK